MSSSGARVRVEVRAVAGQAVELGERDRRARRRARSTRTTASSAASATHMSDGCVAMQCSLAPRIAWMRLKPSIAGQPVPGSRLLHGVPVS